MLFFIFFIRSELKRARALVIVPSPALFRLLIRQGSSSGKQKKARGRCPLAFLEQFH
nr:MAG TPA: hypothetical protein [Caudoviricetes sp.]